MKLLFENWRRFLKEDIGYFGESFVEFKRRTESGEHPLKVANEMLDFVGKGSTRMVFGFPDNKTHLLKIINVETIGDEEAYAEDFVNPMTPAFAVLYALALGFPSLPAIDEIFTIRP